MQQPRTEPFFTERGWVPADFQWHVWDAIERGESGLVHSSTGSGKTLAVWMGYLRRASRQPGLKAIWITPLRALALDTHQALVEACEGKGLTWRIELRTGDTSSSLKSKQLKDLPDVLITTPESLELLLSQSDAKTWLQALEFVVVDEWHELLGSKRGVLTELSLARLRAWNPQLMTWGLSATLGNVIEAAEVLCAKPATLVRGNIEKEIVIDSLLPESMERFPWAGHLGHVMIPKVVEELESSGTCLIFINTRAQAEIWFQKILELRPQWSKTIALHHGSLEKAVRQEVELGLKEGWLRAVVCTSSLDLGVDFSPVDRVFQVGSPKGVSRLLQRAGRSGHRPGVPSRVTCVPTHAMELVDIAAARKGAELGRIEARETLGSCLDVLVQHLVTTALGGGWHADSMRREVQSTHTFRHLTDAEWEWCLDFITRGGESLRAYPQFQRVLRDRDHFSVQDRTVAQRHRMGIGVIVSDAQVKVAYLKGGAIGTVEESFASRLKKGDTFIFGGTALEFVMMKEMTCYVRKARSLKGVVPRWGGGRMPLSSELSQSAREILDEAQDGVFNSPEMELAQEMLAVQQRWSAIPPSDALLIEQIQQKEGHSLFFFPFEGRLVHEGLAALLAYRLSREESVTFTLACNDYGFELLSNVPLEVSPSRIRAALSPHQLAEDIVQCLNQTEMAKRQFREIARVAGLIFQGFPGQPRSAKQTEMSSSLLFEVFSRYDPDHPLMRQAEREVLERNLEQSRLAQCMTRLSQAEILITDPPRPTPFAFPLLVDRLRETVSSESAEQRIMALVASLEADASRSQSAV